MRLILLLALLAVAGCGEMEPGWPRTMEARQAQYFRGHLANVDSICPDSLRQVAIPK